MRTRIRNQLQALAMNEGRRRKTKLWSEQGRAELEKLALAPWASRRRQELLQLLDQLDPTIGELTAAVEQEARKRPEVLRLMTHPEERGSGLLQLSCSPRKLCQPPKLST
jgi:transposase